MLNVVKLASPLVASLEGCRKSRRYLDSGKALNFQKPLQALQDFVALKDDSMNLISLPDFLKRWREWIMSDDEYSIDIINKCLDNELTITDLWHMVLKPERQR